MRPDLSWQGSLLDDGPAQVDVSFQDLRRVQLDDTSWIDVAPGWLRGSDELFAELVQMGRWGQREVHMYEKKVIEPRLTAGWDTDVDGAEMPAALRAISASLRIAASRSTGSGSTCTATAATAWPGTAIAIGTHQNPLVGTVRSAVGGGSCSDHAEGRLPMSSRLGHGDLVVMGGACQHDWEHTVPKEARARGPRISVTLRHSAHLEPRAGVRQLELQDGGTSDPVGREVVERLVGRLEGVARYAYLQSGLCGDCQQLLAVGAGVGGDADGSRRTARLHTTNRGCRTGRCPQWRAGRPGQERAAPRERGSRQGEQDRRVERFRRFLVGIPGADGAEVERQPLRRFGPGQDVQHRERWPCAVRCADARTGCRGGRRVEKRCCSAR